MARFSSIPCTYTFFNQLRPCRHSCFIVLTLTEVEKSFGFSSSWNMKFHLEFSSQSIGVAKRSVDAIRLTVMLKVFLVIPPSIITEYVPASPKAYTSPPVMNDRDPSVLKAYPSPPVMDSGVPSGVSAIPSPSVPVVQTTGPGAQEVSDDQEEALVKDLADMGFKQLDLNKEVLRLNNYDLEKSIDSLCGVSDWDPMLDELQEMGFADDETNRRLLKKNNGSIKRVVMDLINGEKA
ncbi:protein NBR1 [Tanacetum coccineum]